MFDYQKTTNDADHLNTVDAVSISGLRSFLAGGPEGELETILMELRQQKAASAPISPALVLAAANAALSACAEDKYETCIRLLEEINHDGTGYSMLSRLLLRTGSADQAVETAMQLPYTGAASEIHPHTMACWIAAAAGEPGLVAEHGINPPEDCIAGVAATLRVAYQRGDVMEQRRLVDRLLDLTGDELPDPELHQPMPDETIDSADWVLEVVEEIGARLAWLTKRRPELERLTELCGFTLGGSNSLERGLIEALEAGNIDEATYRYAAMCSEYRTAGRLVPAGWIGAARGITLPQDAEEIEKWNFACEEVFLDRSLGHQNLSVWYSEIWLRVINCYPDPESRAAMHFAVALRLSSKLARYEAAKAYIEAGLYAQSIQTAYPLRQFFSFRALAEDIIEKADREMDKSNLRLVS